MKTKKIKFPHNTRKLISHCLIFYYEELKKTIDYIFKNKINEVNIKNYFNYLFTQATDFINKNS